MAKQCDPRALVSLAGRGTFNMWHYATADHIRDVIKPRYFDAAADRLPLGSMIVVAAGGDDTIEPGVLFVVYNDEKNGVMTRDMIAPGAFAKANA